MRIPSTTHNKIAKYYIIITFNTFSPKYYLENDVLSS